MADVPAESSQPEGNNFDNDFEKLDPFSPSHEPLEQRADLGDFGDDFGVSSTTQPQPDLPEEDLYSPTPELVPSAPDQGSSEAEPLVQFGDEPVLLVQPDPQEPEPFIMPTPLYEPPVPDSSAEAVPAPSPSISEQKGATPGAWLKNLDPRVVELLYWRDVKKSGIVFGSLMVLLLSLALFSVLSVVAYLSLAALTVTLSFRIYKNVLGAVQKSGEGHPFKEYLDVDIALPEEKVHDLADVIMKHVSCALREFRRLFLVEDIVDSLKFGLLLWVLTYIGAWFNGMTLIILGIVGVFTLPKVYETYKVQIDQYVDLAKSQIQNVVKQVQEKIPLPGKKKQQ